jgi:GT2 family glycosyltransferase
MANDYPADRLEIVLVDGMSEDSTREIIRRYMDRFPQIRMLDNAKKIIPAAMNLGIARARGDFIFKVDAHSVYPADYITNCIKYLLQFNADMTGGVWTIAARNSSVVAQSIAMALSHPFASGNAYVKIGCKEPRWADAAAFGCWRRSTLASVGPFNEDLAGSSDMELNVRLRRAGGRILLVPQIRVTYYADADFHTLWSHSFSDGVWTTYVLKFGSWASSWRHWVPFAFVAALLGTVLAVPFASLGWWGAAAVGGAYLGVNAIASVQTAMKKKSLKHLPLLPLVFAARHVGHGLGAAYGFLMVLVPVLEWKGRRSAYGQ